MTWEENYLAHHGIKGQQWGIRRFQNEDGTLTEEGKARYLVGKDSKGDPTFGERSFQMYNEVADRANRDLGRINKKYGGDLSKDDAKNLQYTKEIRDMWQNHFKDVLAKDIGTDRSSIEGQKWLKDVFGYDFFDQEVKDLEKKVKDQEKREKKAAEPKAPVSGGQTGKSGKVNMNPKPLKDYSNTKMSQSKAINAAYSDLEKIYPNFSDLPLDTQDTLFFNYLNDSGLYNWV